MLLNQTKMLLYNLPSVIYHTQLKKQYSVQYHVCPVKEYNVSVKSSVNFNSSTILASVLIT